MSSGHSEICRGATSAPSVSMHRIGSLLARRGGRSTTSEWMMQISQHCQFKNSCIQTGALCSFGQHLRSSIRRRGRNVSYRRQISAVHGGRDIRRVPSCGSRRAGRSAIFLRSRFSTTSTGFTLVKDIQHAREQKIACSSVVGHRRETRKAFAKYSWSRSALIPESQTKRTNASKSSAMAHISSCFPGRVEKTGFLGVIRLACLMRPHDLPHM
jgi:hypothetical protein